MASGNEPHPMEALLRPPVELWSTCTAFAAGTLAWLAPWALMMPPGIAMATSLTFSVLACGGAVRPWRVLRYQHHMKRLPDYQVRANQIPSVAISCFWAKAFAGPSNTPSACAIP